ncbi:MAG: MerR family transcriptional regulator [Planctomycetes bacterium]|nr:MerR family transcriptional regulator [Planctomycetota bacterium]
MSRRTTYRVKQLAALTGVTVRTLHHYDAIGLLVPSDRTASGHRLYREEDVLRLHEILVLRAMGLPLEEIRRLLDGETHDRAALLRDRRAALVHQRDDTEAKIRSIDQALAYLEGDRTMSMEDLFDGFDPRQHEAEARERWGTTNSYTLAQRRTARYSKEDWQRIHAENAAILRELHTLQQAGRSPQDDDVRRAADRHRLHIDRWFYPCSPEQHRALVDLYEQDARFRASIDEHGEGLTTFLVAVVRGMESGTEP